MIRLSVCIPTYNFGDFIGRTLDSILPQATGEVEVVVLDGGSTDGTAAAVEGRGLRHAGLRYHRQEFRGGIDRDIDKVVSLARGQYCWLFSADDIMRPDAIATVLETIRSQRDLYLGGHDMCDLELRSLGAYPPPLRHMAGPRLFDFRNPADKNEYFGLANTSEAFFSFLAAPVFRKSAWDAAQVPESFYGTHWIVAGHLLTAVAQGATLQYLDKVLLSKREGNDSFSQGSLINLLRITIEGFAHVADSVFGGSSIEARHVRRVLHRDAPLRALLLARLRAAGFPEREDITVLDRLARAHYAGPGLGNRAKLAIYHLAPDWLLKAAYRVTHGLRGAVA